MTYRERREARAQRLRDQAATRQAKQAGLDRAADPSEKATGIPLGQPILVGHHSERRHRKAVERLDRAMGASVENAQTAARMSARADEIDRQADAAIYDDDPDALDRLRDKLQACEARRDRMKARNAEYRREHRAELKAMGAYERGQAVPFPSYAISNLGGVISATRKRIARLEAVAERGERGRPMLARRAGDCRRCPHGIEPGQPILWYRIAGEAQHQECPS